MHGRPAQPREKFSKQRCFAIVLLLLAATSIKYSALAQAEPVVITENTEQLDLSTVAEFLEDPRGRLTVEELHSQQDKYEFQKIEGGVLNQGVTHSVFWIRFDLRYLSHVGEELGLWLFEVANPALDLITLYVEDPWDGFVELHSGDKHPFDIRDVAHPSFLFPIEMRLGETRRLYLRVETSGVMQVPIKLWTPVAYIEEASHKDMLKGLINGILLVMLFYNLALLLSMRDASYCYFIVYAGAFLLYQASVNGFGVTLIWPHFPVFSSASPFFMSVTGLAGLLFTQSFHNGAEKSRLVDRVFSFALITSFMIMPLSLLASHGLAVSLVTLQLLLTFPTLLVSVLYLWLFKKSRAAKLLVWAFALLLVSGVTHGLSLMNYLPDNFLTRNSLLLGVTVQVVLMSLALAGRTRLRYQDREAVRAEEKGEADKLTQRLIESSRLKDEFLHAISHELKMPLQAVSRSLEHLDELVGEDGAPEQLKLLKTARASNQTSMALLGNLLLSTEVQAGSVVINTSPFNIRRQMSMLKEHFQPACEKKGIALTCQVDEHVPDILYGDAGKLFKALSYLLDNGIKFTRQGGVIFRAAVQQHERPDCVRLNLTVEDTGVGVNVRRGQDIFQAFQQLDDRASAEGFGLGLTLCRQLMHLQEGTVSYIPREEEGGSLFELSLPCRWTLRSPGASAS